MDKYFLIWGDYDSVREPEVFEKVEVLEARYTELIEKIQRDEYGTSIFGVFYGEEIKFKPQKIKTVYRMIKE